MRCFIAIDVPFLESILRLQNDIEGRVKLVEEENIHITLKFLGEISPEKVNDIVKIVRNCAIKKYRLTLKGVGFFPNERYVKVIWIGVRDNGETSRLMRCIDESLSRLGFKKEREYVPHLTVARAKGRVRVKNIENFRNFEFGQILVNKIKIKKSILTERGPIYEDLAVVNLVD